MMAWILGELGPDARLYTSVGPLIVLLTVFAGGLLAYVLRAARGKPVRDPEAEARTSSPLLGRHVRVLFAWLMRPAVDALVRLGVRADAITLLSLLLALASAAALSMGRFALGGWLFLATGLCDYMDGRVARQTGSAGPRGAVLDSVADRYADAAILGALAWYYRTAGPVLALALVALAGSMLVPYVRARGEAAGVRAGAGGWLQRPERVLLLGFATALSPAVEVVAGAPPGWPPHLLAACAIGVLAFGTQATAAGRLARVLDALHGPIAAQPPVRFFAARAAGILAEIGALVLLAAGDRLAFAGAAALACVVGGLLAWLLGARLPGSAEAAFAIASTAILTGCGVALLIGFPDVPAGVAWAAARFAVYAGWSRPLQGRGLLLARSGAE